MQWRNELDRKYITVSFSLRDLRTAKKINQSQLAQALGISSSMYHSIENGQRKPTIDVLFKLASIYKTSMDFVFHAYYRQYFVWHFPEHDLEYAMKTAKSMDIQYLKGQAPPIAPPEIPQVLVWELEGG